MRRHGLSGVLVVLAVLLAAGSVYATRNPVRGFEVAGPAGEYVPPEGFHDVYLDDQGQLTVVEVAHQPPVTAIFSAPGKMTNFLLGANADLVDGGPSVERDVSYPKDDSGFRAYGVVAPTRRGLAQIGAVTKGVPGLVFDPPLLVLPRSAEVGETWTGTGDALPAGVIGYHVDGKLERSKRSGCVVSRIHLTLDDGTSGETLGESTTRDTWCKGRGVVKKAGRLPAPDAGALVKESAAFDFSSLGSSSTATPFTLTSHDESYGDQPYTSGRMESAPAVLADGTVVVSEINSGDVLGVRKVDDTFRIVWRAHPGGVPSSLTAVGNVLVVSSSLKRTCAYDNDGEWLWCKDTPDVADIPGVRLSGDADERGIALASLDGRLRTYDALTGKPVWKVDVPADTALSPVLFGGNVVVAERSGTVTAYDAGSGKQRWQVTLTDAPTALSVDGDRLAVLSFDTRILDEDGTEVNRFLPPTYYQVAALTGSSLLVSSSTDAYLSTPDGTRRSARVVPVEAVVTDGSRFVDSGKQVVRLRAGDGTELESWQADRDDLSSDRWIVPAFGGVLVVDTSISGLVVA